MDKKGKVTQEDIADKCGIDQGSVSRILNNDHRDSFSKETVELVFRTARELGYTHPSIVKVNRRISSRKKVLIPCKLELYTSDNKLWDRGTATICEISASGIVLMNIRSKKQSFPIESHYLRLGFKLGNKAELSVKADPVRFILQNKLFKIAYKFTDLDGKQSDLIAWFCS